MKPPSRKRQDSVKIGSFPVNRLSFGYLIVIWYDPDHFLSFHLSVSDWIMSFSGQFLIGLEKWFNFDLLKFLLKRKKDRTEIKMFDKY